MAAVHLALTTSAAVALTAATAKTVLQAVAAGTAGSTGTDVELRQFSITFNGTTATNEPVSVQLVRQSDAGTSTARNPLLEDNRLTMTAATTGRENATAEPTTTDIVRTFHVHPQGGAVFDVEPPIIIGRGTRLGIRATAPNNVSCLATMRLVE